MTSFKFLLTVITLNHSLLKFMRREEMIANRDSLKHAMIGYLDYMLMTVRNQRWTRAKYLVLIDSLIE